MTAMTTTQPATLTPARKRLIRQARSMPLREGAAWLASLPSFADVAPADIREWMRYWDASPNRKPLEQNAPAKPRQPRKHANSLPEQITQAPPVAEPATGEWYSVAGIAAGVGVTVGRVLVWQRLGWLADGPLVSAENIRAFVRAHPLEAVCGLTHSAQGPQEREACWLWLVSVLAGSREGTA